MCYERWARARDEAVASTYLRDLWQRERKDATPDEADEPTVEDPLRDREPVVVAADR